MTELSTWIDASGYCNVHESYHCECCRSTSPKMKEAKLEASTQEELDQLEGWAKFNKSAYESVCAGASAKFTTKGKDKNLGDCLDEAKATICGERQDQYGSPEDSFALVAKYWEIYLQQKLGNEMIQITNKDIAHMMILFKMARVQGQVPKRDNYIDVCGYAAIAADRF